MKLHQLPTTTSKAKKRIGRGLGSGKGGHTVGKGAKGQAVREKIPLTFAGTKSKKSWIKRLPLIRGKGKFKARQVRPLIVNLKYLSLLPKNSTVNLESLAKAGIVKEEEAKKFGVKILGDGDLPFPLKVALPCSKKAAEKIRKAGGEVAGKSTTSNKSTTGTTKIKKRGKSGT